MWSDIQTDGDKLLANIGHSHRHRGTEPSWLTQRDTMLCHLAAVHRQLSVIADTEPRALTRLAHSMHKANRHLEQNVRRLVHAYNRFTNEASDKR